MEPSLEYTLYLTANDQSQSITAYISNNGTHICQDIFLYAKLDKTHLLELFLSWLTNLIRPILYHESFDQITLKYSIDSIELQQKCHQPLTQLNTIIQNTQKLINRYKDDFEKREFADHLLFYNVDDFTLFKEIYADIAINSPDQTHYLNCTSGWNKNNRSWNSGPQKDSLNLDDLLKFILKNKIKHIYTVDMYYLFQLMENEFFFALPFFKSLGIEWVTIDYDLYASSNGLSFIQRDAFNCPQFRHFSLWPHVLKELDANNNNNNILYFVPNKIIQETSSLEPLKNDYSVIIVSHMRIEMVLSQLSEILFFLEKTDSQETYIDFQMMYYALIHLLNSDKKNTKIEKSINVSYLTSLYFDVLSFLKYDVIQTLIKNNIPSKIYGDDSWGFAFPSVYQNKYLSENEICEKLQSREHLYLLMNQNYSYFESNMVVSRAIQQRAPYLCFTSAVTTQDLNGLKNLEYGSRRELIQKIPIINHLISEIEYKKSLEEFCIKNNACRVDFNESIANFNSEKKMKFKNIYENHEALFLRKLKRYFQENHERVFELYDELFSGNAKTFNIRSSRYYHEEFFQRLDHHFKLS